MLFFLISQHLKYRQIQTDDFAKKIRTGYAEATLTYLLKILQEVPSTLRISPHSAPVACTWAPTCLLPLRLPTPLWLLLRLFYGCLSYYLLRGAFLDHVLNSCPLLYLHSIIIYYYLKLHYISAYLLIALPPIFPHLEGSGDYAFFIHCRIPSTKNSIYNIAYVFNKC